MNNTRRVGTSLAFILAIVLLAAGSVARPAGLNAQEAGREADREHLTEYARAHMAMSRVRDEFQGKLARVHDEEGRLRAREEMEAGIVAILDARDMTRERYDEITLLISLDGELRALFDEIVKELEDEGAGGR
jgi:uncharacterized protein DUF4168